MLEAPKAVKMRLLSRQTRLWTKFSKLASKKPKVRGMAGVCSSSASLALSFRF